MALAKLHTFPDREKYVCLLMDEEHIKSDLVYDKHTGMCSCTCGRNGFLNSCCVIGAVIGFTNIGDVNSHLAAYEEAVEGGEQPEVRLANSMLVLMVRGLFSTPQFLYLQFPCCELSILGSSGSSGEVWV